MKVIDLNADIGEGRPWDAELLEIITSANVCCGVYAGSADLTLRTVELCIEAGVRVGCHPGYADRDGFGRTTPRNLIERGLAASLRDQFDLIHGQSYCKPHGALYHDTMRPGIQFGILSLLLHKYRIPLMGMSDTGHERLAKRAGVGMIREGFADRGYGPDGRLLPRNEPGAVLTDKHEIQAQCVALAEAVDSLCIHGDQEGCVQRARWAREALEQSGYQVAAWH